jgi:transposase-like protein
MSTIVLSELTFVEVKCPSCGRHLDKFKTSGELIVSRKCKSCKNNILTHILGNRIMSNIIDALENSRDILNPKRFSNPFKDKPIR